MTKWISFPVLAAQVWAQQTAPAISDAEKALRARVEQFYQLQLEKKYRLAEALVAEDTKDLYFASRKSDLVGFNIAQVELLDNNTKAKVTVKAKSSMMMMGVGRLPIEIPTVTLWKIEGGNWVWYVDSKAPIPTPFGAVAARSSAAGGAAMPDVSSMVKATDVAAFQSQVTIDTSVVNLSEARPAATATVTNGMPGFVEVTLGKSTIPGVSVDIDKTHVGAGEKAVIHIQRTGAGKVDGTVRVSVSPLNIDFDIQVHGN